jgi:large subunit ribosomal protein L23
MKFPFFKNKKEEKKIEKTPKKAEEKPLVEKPSKAVPPKAKKIRKSTGEAYRILKSLHVTEKATDLSGKNQYVFRIFPRANKPQIKKAVEETFGVDVVNVRVIKIPRKKRRLGAILGWRRAFKKAVVKIKEGQKIEVATK